MDLVFVAVNRVVYTYLHGIIKAACQLVSLPYIVTWSTDVNITKTNTYIIY